MNKNTQRYEIISGLGQRICLYYLALSEDIPYHTGFSLMVGWYEDEMGYPFEYSLKLFFSIELIRLKKMRFCGV